MVQKSTLSVDNEEEVLAFGNLNRGRIQKILENTACDKAFFFYEDINKPTGDFAVNLSEFCDRIDTVSPKSLAFHLKRGDFENWIQETLGDNELATRVKKIKTTKTTWKNEATLRRKLHTVIRNRIRELQDIWHEALKWPEV